MDSPQRDSEFGRFELALGTVRGTRSFNVDPDGGLTGVIHRDPWSGDVNHATCHRRVPGPCRCGAATSHPMGFGSMMTVSGRNHTDGCTGESPCTPDATVPTLDCRCGFYAYFGADDYAELYRASGVIEGFGRTVVGARGFRAQKARILALYLPPDVDDPDAAKAASEPGWEGSWLDRPAVWVGFTAVAAAAGTLLAFQRDLVGVIAWSAVAIFYATEIVDIYRARRVFRRGGCAHEGAHTFRCSARVRRADTIALANELTHAIVGAFTGHHVAPPLTKEQRAGVARRYPAARIYTDRARMLADFPLGDRPATEPATTKEQER